MCIPVSTYLERISLEHWREIYEFKAQTNLKHYEFIQICHFFSKI